MIIFLTNFLALLIRVDVGGDSNRAAFGVLLVAVNVILALAVTASTWFTMPPSGNDPGEEGIPLP